MEKGLAKAKERTQVKVVVASLMVLAITVASMGIALATAGRRMQT